MLGAQFPMMQLHFAGPMAKPVHMASQGVDGFGCVLATNEGTLGTLSLAAHLKVTLFKPSPISRATAATVSQVTVPPSALVLSSWLLPGTCPGRPEIHQTTAAWMVRAASWGIILSIWRRRRPYQEDGAYVTGFVVRQPSSIHIKALYALARHLITLHFIIPMGLTISGAVSVVISTLLPWRCTSTHPDSIGHRAE